MYVCHLSIHLYKMNHDDIPKQQQQRPPYHICDIIFNMNMRGFVRTVVSMWSIFGFQCVFFAFRHEVEWLMADCLLLWYLKPVFFVVSFVSVCVCLKFRDVDILIFVCTFYLSDFVKDHIQKNAHNIGIQNSKRIWTKNVLVRWKFTHWNPKSHRKKSIAFLRWKWVILILVQFDAGSRL